MVAWDMFAALVALAAVPLMLSSSATWFFKAIIFRLARLIWPPSARCERLEWQDIPIGVLRDDQEIFIQHESGENCLSSTIGSVFKHTWISAARRDQWVPKPKELDLQRKYVRVDVKTLQAYVLLVHESHSEEYYDEPTVHFQEVGKILTAHLTASFAISPPSVLKQDLELFLQGYPPLYKTFIKLPDDSIVQGPIRSVADIPRGGWIVAVGLIREMSLFAHNMKVVSSATSEGWIWKKTVMEDAVKRFGHVLKVNIQAEFPNDPMVIGAIKSYDLLITGAVAVGSSIVHFHQDNFLGREFYPDPGIYAGDLDASEWGIAMQAFNHRQTLSEEEITLFGSKMKSILETAFTGLIYVLYYGTDRFSTKTGFGAWKMPSFVEQLHGRKYIYISGCEEE